MMSTFPVVGQDAHDSMPYHVAVHSTTLVPSRGPTCGPEGSAAWTDGEVCRPYYAAIRAVYLSHGSDRAL